MTCSGGMPALLGRQYGQQLDLPVLDYGDGYVRVSLIMVVELHVAPRQLHIDFGEPFTDRGAIRLTCDANRFGEHLGRVVRAGAIGWGQVALAQLGSSI